MTITEINGLQHIKTSSDKKGEVRKEVFNVVEEKGRFFHLIGFTINGHGSKDILEKIPRVLESTESILFNLHNNHYSVTDSKRLKSTEMHNKETGGIRLFNVELLFTQSVLTSEDLKMALTNYGISFTERLEKSDILFRTLDNSIRLKLIFGILKNSDDIQRVHHYFTKGVEATFYTTKVLHQFTLKADLREGLNLIPNLYVTNLEEILAI